MGVSEQKYVTEAFETNWVAPLGPNVNHFEEQLKSYTQTAGAVSLSSGTSALHLGLLALNVKRGDVVICQSLTFAASAFPIVYLGAEPVFIDSEAETWNMDPQLLEQAIVDLKKSGKNPAAIIAVHLYGMPAKMKEIAAVASRYGIPVLEDAAEALGSRYFEKPCGSLSEVGILSFNGNKIITTSGGGALVSHDEEIISKVRHWSAQSKEPAPYYLHKEIGYNFRMSNICAGIGRGQMEVLDDRVKRRREIFDTYRKLLSDVELIEFLPEPEGCFSNRWLTTILLHKKLGITVVEKLRLKLESVNIESRPLWKPLHTQPVFAGCTKYVNGVSDNLFAHGLCLPSGTAMKEESLVIISELIKEAITEHLN
jgi:dTDP-4-amino-4,6-dideoxygalactose transaminase